jgi:hypothetical protein
MTNADSKTMRLATLQVTDALLEQFIQYIKHVVANCEKHVLVDAAVLAQAHTDAVVASNIDLVELQKIRSQVRAFCSGVAVERRIAQRGDSSATMFEWQPFCERYGAETFVRFSQRRDELVSWHERLEQFERI